VWRYGLATLFFGVLVWWCNIVCFGCFGKSLGVVCDVAALCFVLTGVFDGVVRLMRNWLKSRWFHAWVLALVGAMDILGTTDEVDFPDILLGCCSGLC